MCGARVCCLHYVWLSKASDVYMHDAWLPDRVGGWVARQTWNSWGTSKRYAATWAVGSPTAWRQSRRLCVICATTGHCSMFRSKFPPVTLQQQQRAIRTANTRACKLSENATSAERQSRCTCDDCVTASCQSALTGIRRAHQCVDWEPCGHEHFKTALMLFHGTG